MEIFKFIPGFRSGTKWKMLVASIYYFYTLYTLNYGIGAFLLTISCPFFIFSLFDVTRRRGGRRAILTLVISFMLFDLGYSLSQNAPQSANNTKTSTSEPTQKD
ncbi:MAG: hypothetical protein Q8930_09265 [Bacillota bacterium]|nr:hypothetical protein [Bacillota bacterium]